VAKAVYDLSHTRQFVCTTTVPCGASAAGRAGPQIPNESQFSRAFGSFAASELPQPLHAALIEATQKDRMISRNSRHSTGIEAREKPVSNPFLSLPIRQSASGAVPEKGETRLPEPMHLEGQTNMTLERMIDDLPRECNVGTKKNSKRSKESWIGCKFDIDAAGGQILISFILTSASVP
jgi:hypothetical protein